MKTLKFTFYALAFVFIVSTEFNSVIGQTASPTTSEYSDDDWLGMIQDPNVNFYKAQEAFNKFWEGRTDYKGNGWKVFKRWEYINETRVLPDGKLQAPGYVFDEFEKYMDYAGKSASGNWIIQGPTTYLGNNTGQPTGMGRVNAIAFHPSEVNTIFVGSPSGGFWKTTDGGTSWTNLSNNLPTIGVSSILIHPTTPDIIYIGTGDRDASDALPMGVFKSTDGGSTWTQMNNTMGDVTVGVMLMHPSDPNTILAATSGGIYKTSNGGSTWSLKTSGNFKDIKFKPGDPTVVYAVKIETPSEFYRSSDTGDTWGQITSGIPTTGIGSRMVIGVSAANSNYVYLVQIKSSDKTFAGMLLSTNSGVSFSTQSTTPNIFDYACDGSGTSSQATYDLCITVDPSDADIVYVGSINNWKSTDGGVSWNIVSHWVGNDFTSSCAASVHADQHWYEWSTLNGNLYVGNDGGIYYTADGGITWPQITNNLAITQIYKIGQSATNVDYTIFGCQDNGTSVTTDGGAFTTIIGGDGEECIIDYSNTQYCYGSTGGGDIRRSTNGPTGSYSRVARVGSNGIDAGESATYAAPYMLHDTDPDVMFAGYFNVYRCDDIKVTPNTSVTFTAISSGETSTCKVLEQSPADVDILYVVRSGSMKRSDNANDAAGSVTWTTCALPGGSTPTELESHSTNANIVYAAAGYKVYKSTDKGATWTDISANLPSLFINTIVMDKNSTESLYVGNQTGVWFKEATMTDWALFSSGLPPVDIRELEIYYDATPSNSRIKAATYGRGLWQSDLAEVNVLDPTDFTATAVSTSQIDLTWTQNASNDDVIIAWSPISTFGVPTEGVTYSVGNSLPGGGTVMYVGSSTSAQHTGLSENTTYYYKIWSVDGTNQYSAGLPPINEKTYSHIWTGAAGSTDWFTSGNWGTGTVPTSSNGVYIPQASSFQPSINASGAACSNITIESGASLTMNGTTAYTLSVAGNWTNDGTFNRGIGTVDFNGTNALQTIMGSSTTDFFFLKVTKGSQGNTLEATSLITLSAASDALVLTSGTFKLSSASTITPFTTFGGAQINSLSALWNNGGTMNSSGSWVANGGLIRLSSGNINITGSNTLQFLNNGEIQIEGGQLNIGRGITGNNEETSTGNIIISGGTITLRTSTSTSIVSLNINPNTSFTWSGGTIIIRNHASSATQDVRIEPASYNVTGGTLQIGNSSTTASQTIRINSTVPIYNLVVNSTNSPTAQLVTNGLTVLNNVTISGGTLNANNLNLNVGGNWNNNGSYTPGTGTVTFNGFGNQTLAGNNATTFNNLTIDGADVLLGTTAASKLTSVSSALTVNSGKKLTIPSGQFLTVSGTLTNDAGTSGLVIESDATGTGSLIHSTTDVDATVERYLNNADFTNWQDGWHFLSSPVVSQDISPAFTTDPASAYDLYCWFEPDNEWINFKNITEATTWLTANGTTKFNVGKGYMAAYDVEDTKLFTGKLNVGNVNVSALTITGANENRSFHLLGNPFAAAITWDGSAEWNLTNIAGVAKIWNEANQSYSDLSSSPASSIPATNGFMVSVVSGTGSLTIPAAKRSHSAVPFYKSTLPAIMLKAISISEGNAQESRLVVNPLAEQGFDIMFDSEFLGGYAPIFYSLVDGEKYSTNSIPSIDDNTEIPFGFVKNEGSNFRIEITGTETLETKAFLHDLKTGDIVNIIEKPEYSFTSFEGDSPLRFKLKFGDESSSQQENIQVFYSQNTLNIFNAEGECLIEVFGMAGQLLLKRQTTDTSIPINLSTGVYMVRVSSQNGVNNVKIMVN
jgi:photosystem II stability/assembly factor-like uncharacterized protein